MTKGFKFFCKKIQSQGLLEACNRICMGSLSSGFCLLHTSQHFLVIAVGALDTVLRSAVPRTDGFLHVVRFVVLRLNQKEHLFRLVHILAVS